MGFLGALSGAVRGGIGGFIGSGFNPMGAAGGAILGGVAGARGKKRKKGPAVDPMQTPDIMDSRKRYMDLLTGGQDAVNRSSRAAADYALPGFKQDLQGIRESSARRGVSNGEIATGYEDRASTGFQDRIAQAIASNSMGMYGAQLGGASDIYGTDLDVRSGSLDRAQAAENARQQRKRSMWGSLLGAAGTAGGAWLANRGGGRRNPGFAGNV